MKTEGKIWIYSFILLIAFTACDTSNSEIANNNKFPLEDGVEYKHGTKIIVQYEPSKNETSIFQQEFVIHPEVFIDKNAARGKHTFSITNMATFKGKVPTRVPYGCSLTLLHSIDNKSSWHFPPKSRIAFIVDGERVEIQKYVQTKLDKDSREDKEFYESMITEISYENYLKIANAKSLEFQIGNGKFKLSDENILAFKDFTDYLAL